MPDSKKRIVIIGGVACGPKAAARARRRDPDADITIIERGSILSYAGCGLPYYVGGSVPKIDGLCSTMYGVVRDGSYFHNVKDLKVLSNTEAVSINREKKTVNLRNLKYDQSDELPYDKLILAVGSKPFVPSIEGIDLDNVFTLHYPADAKVIRERIDSGEVDHAVIIGAGLIGLEMSESLFNHAVDAVILEKEDHILPYCLDIEMAGLLKQAIERDGIEICVSQPAVRIEGKGKVNKVVTTDREIETDMVILAAGVKPNVELACSAGLAIGETGAISVNEYLQTSDPGIYAGGDCVECLDRVTGKKVYAPLGSTANRHGRIIGNNVTGGHENFPGIVKTTVLKALNVNIARTGLTEMEALDLGYEPVTSITPSMDHVHFYPNNKRFIIKMIARKDNKQLLGAQIIGPGDVAKRIDILATALRFGAALDDVANLDLGYSPPFSHAMDGVIHASNNARNRLQKETAALTPVEAQEKMKQENGLILLDVREPAEVEKTPIQDSRVKTIPLSSLRSDLGELDKDAEIICICQVGVRGYEAYTILEGHGFPRVSFLDGGLQMWPYVSSEKD